MVLSIDETSQIQALDRTQPGQPMKRSQLSTMTHDDKRNGTMALLATLDVIDIHNGKPKPFVWKADPKAIIAAVKRGRQMLETTH